MRGNEARYVARGELEGVKGVVVAIDVLRAFTTAAYAFAAGATAIWLVAGIEEAIELGRSIPGALVMGEIRGQRPPGFDLSNSPVAASQAELAGRELVQRTSAGTQGAIAAVDADRLFVASLVNASATAAAINQAIDDDGYDAPTYVITGRFPDHPAGGEDDVITAQYIERVRRGRPRRVAATSNAVMTSPEAAHTLEAGAGHVHPDDIVFAIAIDRFDFAMEVERTQGRLRVTRRDPTTTSRANTNTGVRRGGSAR